MRPREALGGARMAGRRRPRERSSTLAANSPPPVPEIESVRSALTTYFDLSEHKRAETAALATKDQLRELEAQVRETQKLEPLGLLAGGVAHDFNNILAVIGASAGLLQDARSAEESSELIEDIQRAVARGAALTYQLLAFSRKQVAHAEVIDLNGAIADTIKMLRRMVGERIEIVTSLDPGASAVCIDPGHLVQVLMNLVVNARDAMPRGGTLTISTRQATASTGPEMQLSVTDTGVGMTPEVRRRAMEPLFTTKGEGRGTGLGLSVVAGIVEKALGRIEIQSELGRGTTFRIHLPACTKPRRTRLSSAAIRPRGVETVLFVDDDQYVRSAAARSLRACGYAVLEASEGEAALALLRTCERPVDLLITDVVMPGMTGRELALLAQAEHPSLRVLYISGYNDDEVLAHGIAHDEHPFLQKPHDVHQLACKVREVLDAG